VIATGINGSGSLQKVGDGVLTLTGSSRLTGGIDVQEGAVVVNGSVANTDVIVAAAAALGGSGVVGGTVSGDGLIGPGNSPGILTFDALNAGSAMSFAFEMTQLGDPTWSAVNSGNDVLRLTNLTTPFVASLAATNVVGVYFNVTTLSGTDTFNGAFFTDKSEDFLSSVAAASFEYFVKGDGNGTVTYNGNQYYQLNRAWVTVSTVQVASADFASGTVSGGYATSFAVVPEPGSFTLAALGIATAAWAMRRRRLKAKAAA
jgi:autotransporter-associated beta strand protein